MSDNEKFLTGECGIVGLAVGVLPTLLFIISEIMGLSSAKSNGISHFIYCILNKCIKKEKITNEDIIGCLATENHNENNQIIDNEEDSIIEV